MSTAECPWRQFGDHPWLEELQLVPRGDPADTSDLAIPFEDAFDAVVSWSLQP